jgi:hypothetical protein
MGRFRFSIAALVGVVLFVGVALAALRAADDSWDCGVFGLALGALTTAVLLTIHRTGRRRAYWLGFTLFGWTYLVASLVPPVEARLPTTKGLTYLDSKVPGRQKFWPVAFTQCDRLPSSSQGVVRIWDTSTGRLLAGLEDFVQIGHSLLALVLAFLGGHLSRCLHTGGRDSGEPGGSPVAATTSGGA